MTDSTAGFFSMRVGLFGEKSTSSQLRALSLISQVALSSQWYEQQLLAISLSNR